MNPNLRIACFVFVCLLLVQAPLSAFGQEPIYKERVLQALQERKLPQDMLVGEVRKNGVNFELTSTVEEELKKAGATPELLKAIRESYKKAGQPQATEVDCKEQAQIRLFPVTKEQALADKVVNLKDKLTDDLHYKDVEGPWNNDNPNDNPPTSEIRWFYKEDKKCAEQLKRELKAGSANMTVNIVEGKNPGGGPPLHTIHVYVK